MLTHREGQTALVAIRRKESETAQRLLAAQNKAVQEIAQARQRAEAMVAQAVRDGQQAGEKERQVMLAAIEEEARAILEQARMEADRWQAEGERQVATAVTQLISLICGDDSLDATRAKGFGMPNGHHAKEQSTLDLEVWP